MIASLRISDWSSKSMEFSSERARTMSNILDWLRLTDFPFPFSVWYPSPWKVLAGKREGIRFPSSFVVDLEKEMDIPAFLTSFPHSESMNVLPDPARANRAIESGIDDVVRNDCC